jgi:hypothetical protein
MSTELAVQSEVLTPEIMEAVVVGGDLAKLGPDQRLSWYRARCQAADLDPRTQPFIYLYLNNKLQLYATKSASDQLIAKHKLDVQIVERRYDQELGLYEVRTKVQRKDGTSVEDVGVMFVANLKGEALANAVMKCFTKSKRRTVLSACGLGMPDESEAEFETTASVIGPPPKQLGNHTQPQPPSAIEIELPGQPQSGADSRPYSDVVKTAVEAVNAEIEDHMAAALGGEVPLRIEVAEAYRFLANAAIQNGLYEGSMPANGREAATMLMKVYKLHRDAMRTVLKEFLDGKYDEAGKVVEDRLAAKTEQQATSEEDAEPEPPAPAQEQPKPAESPTQRRDVPEPAEPPPPPEKRRPVKQPPAQPLLREPGGDDDPN